MARGELEADVNVPPRLLDARFGVWTPADDVSSETHRLIHQLIRAPALQDAFLGKGDDLEVETVAIGLAELHECLDAEQLFNRINVRVRSHVGSAVDDCP